MRATACFNRVCFKEILVDSQKLYLEIGGILAQGCLLALANILSGDVCGETDPNCDYSVLDLLHT